MAKAILMYEDIPGFEELAKGIFKNPQFVQEFEFDFMRRLVVKAKKISRGTYRFNVNGITYVARMKFSLNKAERKYYENVPKTCLTELSNIYP